MGHTSYTVVSADLARDETLILDLWRQNFQSSLDARFDWMYRNNPLGNPYCLLLRTADDQTIGATCVVRRQLRFKNKSLTAGQAIDLVVNRAHRSGGPAIQLQRALTAGLAENKIHLLYSTPLPGAELIARRVGYRVLDQFQRWTKPLRFERELHNRIKIPFAPLRKLAGALLDIALLLWSGELFFRAKHWNTSVKTTFDHRFDDLWSKAISQFDILGDRSAAYLTWRFGGTAISTYRVFCLSDDTQTLAGYVIFSRHNATAKIADILAADLRWLRPLLLGFTREMRREGAENLTFLYVGSDAIGRALKSCGFFKRPEKSNMLIYVNGEAHSSAMELLEPSRWYLTDADRDV
jgi:hypothetical protein